MDLSCPGSSHISGGGCLCQATISPPDPFEFTNGFQYLANGPANCDGDGCTRWFCSCFNNSTDTLDLDLSINVFLYTITHRIIQDRTVYPRMRAVRAYESDNAHDKPTARKKHRRYKIDTHERPSIQPTPNTDVTLLP